LGRISLSRDQRIAAAWALLLTSLVMLPVWLGDGFVLSYDMVAVPSQDLQPWMWGGSGAPPRAVPQDVYVALLDNLMDGELLQKLLLSLVLVGAMGGIAALLHPVGPLAQAAAMSAYVWSAYYYERLVIGHWGLLLACAALPWAVLAATWVRRGRRAALGWLVVVVFLGTWVPTGGVILVAVSSAIVLWPGGAVSIAQRGWAVLGSVVVQATWLVPALLTAGDGQPSFGVFGLRPNDHLGVILAAVGGSGVWNSAAVPGSRGGVFGVFAAVLVLGVAVVGVRPLSRAIGAGSLSALALVSGLLLVWAVTTGLPGLEGVAAAVERFPGGGLLRDGQKWLAPWWLTVSLAFGCAAGLIGQAIRADRGGVAIGGLLVLIPLAFMPDLAWAAVGRLTPAPYPADWDQVAVTLGAHSDDDVVASLPWGAFRRYAWNSDRVVLDPAPRYLPRDVVTDTTLLVGSGPTAVAGDDVRGPALQRAVRADDPAAALRSLGVGWVLLQRDQPIGLSGSTVQGPMDLKGSAVLWEGPWLTLVRLVGEVTPSRPPSSKALVLLGWLAALMAVSTALGLAIRMGREERKLITASPT